MKYRTHTLTALVMGSLLLSGCAAAAGTPGEYPSGTGAQSSAAAGTGHTGGHDSSSPASGSATADGPSDAARMVCGDQTMGNVTSILGLNTKPHTVDNWANSTYSCTYHLTDGALKITVQQAPTQTKALEYFKAMQALAKDAKTIEGLANLGFPAFETTDGSAVFQKDNMILHVNASALPAALGPENITRTEFAYQLSTTILACWTEHP